MFPVSVPITRPATREALDQMLEKLASVFTEVQEQAFNAFLARGNRPGSDLDDWCGAERELFRLPEAELRETATAVTLIAAVPGFNAHNLYVQVLPELIVLEGKVQRKTADPVPHAQAEATDDQERVYFSDLNSKPLFRQFRLATPINVATAKATLKAGILTISAVKQAAAVAPQAVEVEGLTNTSTLKTMAAAM